jgi:hypothetical protein
MNTQPRNNLLWVAVALLVLAALACNAAREEATETPIVPSTTPLPPATQTGSAPSSTATSTAEPAASPAATDTPAPDVSGPGGCAFNARYVADVTVPDDTQFDPGKSFSKTWRIQNSGTCAWETGIKLAYVSGDPLGGPVSISVPATAPGANVDLTVNLVAPSAPGTYRSNWRLQDADGVWFGNQIYVQIVVPQPITATPTLTPTTAATPPDLIITNLEVDTDDPRQGMPLHIVATLRNQGGTSAENVYWAWRVCVEANCQFTEAPGPVTLDPSEEVVATLEYEFNGWSTYTTEAWVDSRETVAESDEDHNTRQLTIVVKEGKPDLIVASITYDPSPPTEGQDTEIEVKVANQGSKDSTGFTVEWWSSTGADQPRCTWTVSGGLAAGTGVKLTCTYAYPSWYSNITTRAVVDVADDINELDEDNNSLDKTIEVKKP